MSQLRLSSLMLGAGGAIAGTAAADLPGNAEVLPAILCILFAMSAQLCANFYRRYYIVNTRAGRPLGASFPTRPANEEAAAYRICSLVALFLTLTVGCMLVTMGGWWTFGVGAIILLMGWLCAGGPHPIMRTPWSILATFILFGPVCVITTALIQIRHDFPDPMTMADLRPTFFAAAVIGLMAANANLVYNYHDIDFDRELGRKSVATIMGKKTVRVFFFINGLVFTGIMAWSCFVLDLDNPWVALIAPAICFLVNLYVGLRLRTSTHEQLHGLIKVANSNVLLMSILMLIMARALGDDDTSTQTFFGSLLSIF